MKRRELLRSALATPFLITSVGCASLFRSQKYPFAMGVASGSPLPDGFVLWTRLAPEPLQGDGGMPATAVAVTWELAEDEGFKKIVRTGQVAAEPALGHSVHVEVNGLPPDRWYWYRFHTTDATSPVGRTRTAPALNAMPSRFRFAYGSCQSYVHGYYVAYKQMVQDNLDLVVWLGDYIYEYGKESKPYYVREHFGPECKTLEQYRTRYGQYKSDPLLQRMHEAAPWITVWDDHEVGNDLANDRLEDDNDPQSVLKRRVAGYQAYYENLPLRPSMIKKYVGTPHMKLYGENRWGQLANIYLMDTRQYKNHQVCPDPKKKGGGNIVTEDKCSAERLDPKRSILGAEQEKWLLGAIDRSTTRWNILGQQTLFSQMDVNFDGGPKERKFRTDAWDGYPASRKRITDFLLSRKPTNPVIIGGDVHSHWVCDVKANYDDPKSPVVASEFIGTSLGARYPSWTKGKDEIANKIAKKNPHVKYTQVEKRGYVLMDLTPERNEVSLVCVDNWQKADSKVSVVKKFAVINGKLGPQEA